MWNMRIRVRIGSTTFQDQKINRFTGEIFKNFLCPLSILLRISMLHEKTSFIRRKRECVMCSSKKELTGILLWYRTSSSPFLFFLSKPLILIYKGSETLRQIQITHLSMHQELSGAHFEQANTKPVAEKWDSRVCLISEPINRAVGYHV